MTERHIFRVNSGLSAPIFAMFVLRNKAPAVLDRIHESMNHAAVVSGGIEVCDPSEIKSRLVDSHDYNAPRFRIGDSQLEIADYRLADIGGVS